jgi:hypothetical protein
MLQRPNPRKASAIVLLTIMTLQTFTSLPDYAPNSVLTHHLNYH